MYFYKIFRLIIIAVIITYFIGCIWFLLSISLSDPDEENYVGKPRSFIEKFGLDVKYIDQTS